MESFLLSHYATPHPHAAYLTQIVKNMVAITGDYYFALPREKRFSFLTCVINVLKISFALKSWESRLSAVDAAQQQSGKPLFFASLTELIGPLEAMQKALQEIDAELPIRRVVLVEGDTEEAFIRSIQLRSTVLDFDFGIHVYGGRGGLKNIIHYVAEKNRQGVRVDLSVDYDGQSKSKSFVEKLTASCSIQSVFGFGRDFEAAFPPELLHAAVQEYLRLIAKLSPEVVTLTHVRMLLADQKPFTLAFEDKFGLNISKPKLGTILGEIVLGTGAIWEGVVKETSDCSEIAKFVRFLMLW